MQITASGKKDTGKCSAFRLFVSFLKVGIIGFGGGSSLIPIVERELVESKKMMNADEYVKHTIIANITPGALPVKLGATCGYELGGIGGSVAAAYAVSLPGVVLTVTLVALIMSLGQGSITYINCASVGITAFIVHLLLAYIGKTLGKGDRKTNLLLCAAAFALTGGKELRAIAAELLGRDAVGGYPVFDISTIQLMLVTFFMILLSSITKSRRNLLIGAALCVLFSFLCGKTGTALGFSRYGKLLWVPMAVWLLILFLRGRESGKKKTEGQIPGDILTLSGVFLGIPLAVVAAALLLRYADAPELALKTAFSTATSFGGGEAYISVAEGIFVQGGYMESDFFYTRLVPVANALPGPILVKIASGIGFAFGQKMGVGGTVIFMLTTMCAAVGTCCAIAVLLLSVYDQIQNSVLILNLRKYVLAVICGMLLSTASAMISEALHVTGERGIGAVASLPAIILAVLLLRMVSRKCKLPDIVLLLAAAAISLCVLVFV